MNFLKRLFVARVQRRSASAGSAIPIPLPGESWIFDYRDGSPWSRQPGPVVTVRDVRDGWVRYDIDRTAWTDQRTTLKTFRELYRPNAGGEARIDRASEGTT